MALQPSQFSGKSHTPEGPQDIPMVNLVLNKASPTSCNDRSAGWQIVSTVSHPSHGKPRGMSHQLNPVCLPRHSASSEVKFCTYLPCPGP